MGRVTLSILVGLAIGWPRPALTAAEPAVEPTVETAPVPTEQTSATETESAPTSQSDATETVVEPLTSSEPQADESTTTDEAPVPVAEAPAVDEAQQALLRALSHAPLVRVGTTAGSVEWGNDELGFQVVKTTNSGAAIIDSAVGQLTIDPGMVVSNDPADVSALGQLLDHLQAAELDLTAENLVYGSSLLVDHRLRGDRYLVIQSGILEKTPAAVVDRGRELQAVAETLPPLIEAIEHADLDRLAKRTMIHVLERSAMRPGGDYEGDEVTPSYARRVIRHGWLDRVLPDLAPVDAYATALSEACVLAPALAYRAIDGNEDLQLDRLVNAFGEGGWLVRTPDGARAALTPRIPFYHWSAQASLSQTTLVLDLPPSVSIAAANDGQLITELFGARLYDSNKRMLAGWSSADGFAQTTDTWRTVVSAQAGLSEHIVSNYMPPHVTVTDLYGDIDRIITQHGALVPPLDQSADAAHHFLQQAATTLPDAAHLDLIGQYIFQYVYDSPDPANPFLIGTPELSSDIHQTAEQTLSTTTGGQCRGDCDDLSELYQDILDLQGKTAHVISLPAHAAVSWAEQQNDQWHVYVMQTGPTLEFTDSRLQDALAQAYKRFDATDTFDPNGLGLLLRFSGENTRSGWRLSYRIFSEPDYAETMIDVQRDWHYQTYLQGINKMEQLIASGDEDTANYRELAGLFSFTGQHASAAEYLSLAIDRTEEPDSVLFQSAELAHHYLEADMEAEAEAVISDILDQQLPALQEQLGPSVLQYGLQLAGYLIDGDKPELALQVLTQTVNGELAEGSAALVNWLREGFDQRTWEGHPHLLRMRRLLNWYAGTASSALLQLDDLGGISTNPDLQGPIQIVQTWVNTVALRDIDDPGYIPMRYADVGQFYQAILGFEPFIQQVLSAGEPPAEPFLHHERVGGVAQLQMDLPWIKISPVFWSQCMGRLVHDADNKDDINQELLNTIVQQFHVARQASEERGHSGALLDRMIHNGLVTSAILTENADTLRERMRFIREKDDKRLRDGTAQTMGELAKYTDSAWFDQMVELWVEELDYKPKYYWIAWRAALNGAPDRALQVAEIAAERFADDAAFTEEYEFMQQLFAD